MNIIIITCPGLIASRLAPQINQLLSILTISQSIDSLHIITAVDDKYSQTIANYRPELWTSQIKSIAPFLYANLLTTSSNLSSPSNTDLFYESRYESDVLKYFLPRKLTSVEHSIYSRHFHALRLASSFSGRSLILEDDALISHMANFSTLVDFLDSPSYEDSYLDCSSNYIPLLPSLLKKKYNYKSLAFVKANIAFTRTLLAYSVSSGLSKLMLDFPCHYALPVDMHYQFLFWRLGISGFSLTSPVFDHLSKTGLYHSSTS